MSSFNMDFDNRPYFVRYTDTDGVVKETYAGCTATVAARSGAVIQARGCTDVCLVRKDVLAARMLGFR